MTLNLISSIFFSLIACVVATQFRGDGNYSLKNEINSSIDAGHKNTLNGDKNYLFTHHKACQLICIHEHEARLNCTWSSWESPCSVISKEVMRTAKCRKGDPRYEKWYPCSYLRDINFLVIGLKITHPNISLLEVDFLSNFPVVQNFECTHTQLFDIKNGTFSYENKAIGFFGSIIDLSNNHLTSVRAGVFQDHAVKELYLHSNKIDFIEDHAFDKMLRLEILDLSFNQIRLLDPRMFINNVKLKMLMLAGNFLESVPDLSKLSLLQSLDLDRNSLKHLDKSNFYGLNSLENLTLSRNKLDYFVDCIEHMKYIKDINLSFNELKFFTISFETDETPKYPRNIQVQGNIISRVDINIPCYVQFHFKCKLHLNLLDLGHNNISSLKTSSFSLVSIKRLVLSNNSLQAFIDSSWEVNHQLEISVLILDITIFSKN